MIVYIFSSNKICLNNPLTVKSFLFIGVVRVSLTIFGIFFGYKIWRELKKEGHHQQKIHDAEIERVTNRDNSEVDDSEEFEVLIKK